MARGARRNRAGIKEIKGDMDGISTSKSAIETTSDEAAKPRLRRCVPPLLVAVKNWAGSPAGEVVMAAATPKAAFMFVADDWPDIDEGEFQTHEVARALVGAIESSAPNKSDVILGATAALLGEAGLDAQREEQERILRERGDRYRETLTPRGRDLALGLQGDQPEGAGTRRGLC
jgi:hypothetical protein